MKSNSGEKHLHVIFEEPNLSVKEISALKALYDSKQDLIIDLSAINSADAASIDAFNQVVDLFQDRLCLIVADEEQLEKIGLDTAELACTPTYAEAVDYLFMMQIERELGEE